MIIIFVVTSFVATCFPVYACPSVDKHIRAGSRLLPSSRRLRLGVLLLEITAVNSWRGLRGSQNNCSGSSSSDESTRRRYGDKWAVNPLGPARCGVGGAGIWAGCETGRTKLSRAMIRSMTSPIRMAPPGRAAATRSTTIS